MTPYYEADGVTIYHGDCRDYLPGLSADVVVTDPPYPNKAGHFDDGIAAAEQVLASLPAPAWLVFWHQLTVPPVPLPLVARHVWHRTNTNRPDNYEAIYEFANRPERASRVFAYPVIFPGLTGCIEATGHPTQKNERLMRRLLALYPEGTVLDPFMGSGTTVVAAKSVGRTAIGIEKDERWCEVTAKRLAQGVLFGATA